MARQVIQQVRQVFIVALVSGALLITLYVASIVWPKSVDRGQLETIHGIPYPQHGQAIEVTESLAHTDVYLAQPAAFSALTITLDFDPQQLDQLSVGLRQDSFWLSYPKLTIYQKGSFPRGRQTRTLTIPATTAFQEQDQSLDLMFFAVEDDQSILTSDGTTSAVNWKL
ncbi:MAG: hypothetical protein ACRD4B_08760, partial [Acidobacteriota bacterium]